MIIFEYIYTHTHLVHDVVGCIGIGAKRWDENKSRNVSETGERHCGFQGCREEVCNKQKYAFISKRVQIHALSPKLFTRRALLYTRRLVVNPRLVTYPHRTIPIPPPPPVPTPYMITSLEFLGVSNVGGGSDCFPGVHSLTKPSFTFLR